MFHGPKGYIAQICEVHLQYGNSTTNWPFYTFFLVNSTLIYILFSLVFHHNYTYWRGLEKNRQFWISIMWPNKSKLDELRGQKVIPIVLHLFHLHLNSSVLNVKRLNRSNPKYKYLLLRSLAWSLLLLEVFKVWEYWSIAYLNSKSTYATFIHWTYLCK